MIPADRALPRSKKRMKKKIVVKKSRRGKEE
jgi:hypothetical protein